MSRLMCYVLKCVSKCPYSEHYKFNIGSIYYARSGIEKLDSVGIYDNISMYRYTGLDRCYFFNGDGLYKGPLTFLGYNWELLKVAEVDEDFDFNTGKKNLISVMTKEDLKYYNDKVYEYEHNGGSLEFLPMLMAKYADAQKII